MFGTLYWIHLNLTFYTSDIFNYCFYFIDYYGSWFNFDKSYTCRNSSTSSAMLSLVIHIFKYDIFLVSGIMSPLSSLMLFSFDWFGQIFVSVVNLFKEPVHHLINYLHFSFISLSLILVLIFIISSHLLLWAAFCSCLSKTFQYIIKLLI